MVEQVDAFEIPRKRMKRTNDIGKLTRIEQPLKKITERRIVDDVAERRGMKMMRSARRAISGPVQPTEEFTTNRTAQKVERRVHGMLPDERQNNSPRTRPNDNGRGGDNATPPGKRQRRPDERTNEAPNDDPTDALPHIESSNR